MSSKPAGCWSDCPNWALSLDNVMRQLKDEGVAKFNKPFDKLMETLAQKSPLHEVRES